MKKYCTSSSIAEVNQQRKLLEDRRDEKRTLPWARHNALDNLDRS